MPKFLVEAISQYRMVYVIDTVDAQRATDIVACYSPDEFGQQWLGETILSSREIDDAEAIRVHDEMNDYLKDWTPEMKLARIHKVAKE